MVPANNLLPGPDLIRMRRALQASLTQLMNAQEYLARQIDILTSIEQQVRLLALGESSRCLDDHANTEKLHHLRDLQEQTNANFRRIRESYDIIIAQIAKLMIRHECLYDATFAKDGRVTAH